MSFYTFFMEIEVVRVLFTKDHIYKCGKYDNFFPTSKHSILWFAPFIDKYMRNSLYWEKAPKLAISGGLNNVILCSEPNVL